MPTFALRPQRLVALALFTFAGTSQLLHAQTPASVSAPIQSPSAALPSSPSAPASSATAPAPEPMGLDGGAAAFGQPPAPSPYANSIPGGRNRSTLDPFGPGRGFGNFGAPNADYGGNPMRIGGRQAGANPFGTVNMGRRPDQSGPLFPTDSSLTGGRTGSANASFGAAPGTLPSLNQLMRGNLSLPLSTSYGAFRFSFRDNLLGPDGNLGDLGRPSASAMFSTSDLGNGMYLSAGMSGSRSMAGAPAAGFGGNQSGGDKHSGTSLAIKLSF
ncbi:MAG: hypothetical protein ABR956_16180 [Terracidiphilus sp.]